MVGGIIAFFDFDGTITHKDSLLEFIKYSRGKFRFYRGFMLYAPTLLAYKLKLLSGHRAKEIMLKHFFGKMSEAAFLEYCSVFLKEVMPALIRPKALREIDRLKQAGARIVIVSASPENWLKDWCHAVGADCIATRLEVCEGRITGKIEGKNCHGPEKVVRIRQQYPLDEYASIYCYGDTPGDLPMLALGTIRFYRPFR